MLIAALAVRDREERVLAVRRVVERELHHFIEGEFTSRDRLLATVDDDRDRLLADAIGIMAAALRRVVADAIYFSLIHIN